VSVQKVYCVYFTAKQGHQELVKSPWDWKISLKFQEIKPKLAKIAMHAMPSRIVLSLKVKRGYISEQKLKSERSKNFAVSISLQTNAIRR